MASIDLEQEQERQRMAAERIAEGRSPTEDIAQYQSAERKDPGGDMIDTGTGNPVTHTDDPNASWPNNPNAPSPPPGGTTSSSNLQARANALLKQYGITDPGNIQSLLSGRSNWDEYFKDTVGRATNTPGYSIDGNNRSVPGVPDPRDPRVATTTPGGRIDPAGGGPSRPTSGLNYGPNPLDNIPGYQFNDPYSKLLEEIAQKQLLSLTGQNPQTQQLMDFLNKRFSELSTSQGYSPDELAVLNTQAMEPIEALRKASQQRELQRTSAAGYLPTSGITLDQQRLIDQGSDQARTAANRDLSINAINQRSIKQNEALQLAQLGVQIPQQQNAQALDVANLLYQLPRQAMLDANTVVNGSSPQNAIGPYIQLLQQQQAQNAQQQQQDAAFWAAIGQQLLGLFN